MRSVTPVYVAVLLLVTACGTRTVTENRQAKSAPAEGGAAGADRLDRIAVGGRPSLLASAEPAAAPASFTLPTASDSVPPSMLIRRGEASVQVDSLGAGIAGVRLLAQRVGGYVANVSERMGGAQVHAAMLELKIPSARFDEALDGLRPLGRLDSVNVTAEDVGEEYVDVGARLDNSRRLEQRLVALLATRTGKLSDVLAVERELARVREEIERYEGRLRYLRTRAALSTLSVTVHEPFPVVGERGSGSVIAESFRDAWRNFVHLVAGLIAALGFVIPIGAFGVAVWLLTRRGKRGGVPKAA